MVSADIFRGRYRESLETPKPSFRISLCFIAGSANGRIMFFSKAIGYGSSTIELVPLYDRNPQTFVPNIFWAQTRGLQEGSAAVYHAPGQASFIELPLVTAPEGWLDDREHTNNRV